jgi:hypothetical protein
MTPSTPTATFRSSCVVQQRITPEKIRMNSLVLAVIAIAVAQALTILLTAGREREIKKLRELVNEQRLHIVELRAWMAGRNATQPGRTESERKPIREPIANKVKAQEATKTPEDLSEKTQPRSIENEAGRGMAAANLLKEIQNAQPGRRKPEPIAEPEPTLTPNPTRPRLTEDEIKDAIGDAAKAREIFAVLHGTSSEKMG